MALFDEKWTRIYDMLNDEDEFSRVHSVVLNSSSQNFDQDVFFQEFQTLDNFAAVFDRWIRIQTQPFLSVKMVDDVSSVKIENIQQQSFLKLSTDNPSSNSNRTFQNPKNKVRPTTISASLPNDFGQNSFSMSQRSSGQKPTTLSQTENQWPSLSETVAQSIPKQVKTQSKKKRITPTLSIPKNESNNTLLQQQEQQQQQQQQQQPSSSSPTLPVPSLIHQLSTSVKSHHDLLGVVVEVFDSKKEVNNSTDNSHLMLMAVLNGSQGSTKASIARLARLYSTLVKSKLVPVIPTILLLSRLLSSRHTCATVGKEITISISNSRFPSYFLDNNCLGHFLTEISLHLADIIQSLGDQFCGLYAELVLELSPIVSQTLLSRARRSSSFTQQEYNELYPYLGWEQSNTGVDREEYIRPFHDERDNRHEYRGKVEGIVYNEREKCFDEFSNLFRRYSEVSRSDLDGSKTEEFWPILGQIGTKILALNDCNFIWFAQIFKDMLLFHGTNLPKVSSSDNSDSFKIHGINPERYSPHPGSSQFRQLEERLGPGGGAQGTHTMNSNRQTHFNETNRSHLLSTFKDPSSLFPGYQQFFFRFVMIMDSAKLNQHLSDIFIEEILTLTDILSSGEYKIFLNELRSGAWVMDSLTQQMLNIDEIYKLNSSSSSSSSSSPAATSSSSSSSQSTKSLKAALFSSHESFELTKKHVSFNIRIFQLRILGKFLGLIHSYPTWTRPLSVPNLNNSSYESPLIEMITRATALRNSMSFERSSSLPMARLLYLSWQDSTLTLSISWIINYLRMFAWDSTSVVHLTLHDSLFDSKKNITIAKCEHVSTVAVLSSILSSREYNLTYGSLSRNRLYVLLEIQSFFAEFSNLQRLQPALLPFIRSPHQMSNSLDPSLELKQGNHVAVDEGDAAFSDSFTKHVIPSLYDMSIHLQQRKGWAHNYLKKKLHSTDNSMSMKRLIPTSSIPPFPSLKPTNGSTLFDLTPPGDSITTTNTNTTAVTPIMSFTPPSLPSFVFNKDPSISSRLEAAFWHSYPYLQQLFLTFLQHLTSSCQKNLKEKVADMIVSAWDLCEGVKKDFINVTSSEFLSQLNESLNSLYLTTLQNVEKYLHDFILFHFTHTLLFQFEMYSLSKGVLSTLIQLTNLQKNNLITTNLNYFTTYAMKKMNEVKIVCQQQRSKLELPMKKKLLLDESIERSRLVNESNHHWNLDHGVLISNFETLQCELQETLQEHCSSQTPLQAQTQSQIQSQQKFYLVLLPPHSKEINVENQIPSIEELSLVFTTKLCNLQIVIFPWSRQEECQQEEQEMSQEQEQQQELEQQQEREQQLMTSINCHDLNNTPCCWNSVHHLCGRICRFISSIVTIINKFILFYSSLKDISSHPQLLNSIFLMIQNISQFISTLQHWCHHLKSPSFLHSSPSITSSASNYQESMGRISIEFNKLYLEIQFSILFFSSFLQQHSSCLQQTNIGMTFEPPLKLILEAYEFKLITLRTMNRLLSSTLKLNSLVFFPSFPLEEFVLSLLREFLQRFFSSCLLSEEISSPSSPPSSSPSYCSLGSLLEAERWYENMDVSTILKLKISNEFAYLYDQVVQRYQNKQQQQQQQSNNEGVNEMEGGKEGKERTFR